jgi:hypothetical protein
MDFLYSNIRKIGLAVSNGEVSEAKENPAFSISTLTGIQSARRWSALDKRDYSDLYALFGELQSGIPAADVSRVPPEVVIGSLMIAAKCSLPEVPEMEKPDTP